MFAASKAATRDMTKVTFGPGNDIPGLICGPKGAPAVVVLQEWWGITDQILEHAGRVASIGFRVIVPDLYKGKQGVNAEEASHLMGALDFPAALAEVGHAAKFLRAEGSRKVGVVGFCMGGALALGAAAASPDISCAVSFYGVNTGLFTPEALAAKPVSGHFGAADAMAGFSDPDTARALETLLRGAGSTQVGITVHPGVGHAFMNTSPAPFDTFEDRQAKLGFPPFDERTAEAAWSGTNSFLMRHLVFGA
jgi:carboxymethylenebutenolidase